MSKLYRVRVTAKVDLIYEVEADTASEAKEEALAMAEANDLPSDLECTDIGKAVIDKEETF